MNRISLLICLLAAFSLPVGYAHDTDTKSKCSKVRNQIKVVQSRMRAGYTRAQGERLEARLRKLKADRSKYCR